MLAILNSLNAHNFPIFQSILIILVSKFMVHRALLDKIYLSLGFTVTFKPSNKTKEKIVEGFFLRVTTMSRACEPVLEVETDLADSGAQLGSVSNSWLVILPVANYHIFQVEESGPGPLDINVVVISICFQHSSCRINSTIALRGTFILELMPPKQG